MERERLFNVPNVITGIRIGLIGLFLLVHFGCPFERKLSLGLFISAGCTDFLDGMAARRLGQITWLGKILDPIADKLLILASLVCLYSSGNVPLLLLVIAGAKEMYMILGGVYLFRRQVVIASDMPGKIATFLFVPSVILIYPWHDAVLLRSIGTAVLYVSLAISVGAAVRYTHIAVKKSNALKTD